MAGPVSGLRPGESANAFFFGGLRLRLAAFDSCSLKEKSALVENAGAEILRQEKS